MMHECVHNHPDYQCYSCHLEKEIYRSVERGKLLEKAIYKIGREFYREKKFFHREKDKIKFRSLIGEAMSFIPTSEWNRLIDLEKDPNA